MSTLREIVEEEGITEQVVPDVSIPTYDPMMLLELQALFGQMIATNADLTRLVNAAGPALFGMLLFTISEDYHIDPNDPDVVVARNSTTEAESQAIGVIRGVAAAMGALEGDLTSDPSDDEVEADTEISPIN